MHPPIGGEIRRLSCLVKAWEFDEGGVVKSANNGRSFGDWRGLTSPRQWMPRAESVPGGTLRVAGLASAVVIGILYLQRTKLGLDLMLLIGAFGAAVGVIALVLSVFTNTRYSFTHPASAKREVVSVRTLDGHELTAEALRISVARSTGPQPCIRMRTTTRILSGQDRPKL